MSSTLKPLDTGVVSSPNHPGNYPHNIAKTATIQVEEGLVIQLKFTTFSTADCNDHLTITDGDGSTLMGRTCGSSLPADIKSANNVVEMFFKTDGSGTGKGWSVKWSAVTPGEQTAFLKFAL